MVKQIPTKNQIKIIEQNKEKIYYVMFCIVDRQPLTDFVLRYALLIFVDWYKQLIHILDIQVLICGFCYFGNR